MTVGELAVGGMIVGEMCLVLFSGVKKVRWFEAESRKHEGLLLDCAKLYCKRVVVQSTFFPFFPPTGFHPAKDDTGKKRGDGGEAGRRSVVCHDFGSLPSKECGIMVETPVIF